LRRPAQAATVALLVALAAGLGAALAQEPNAETALGLLAGDRSAKVRAQASLALRAFADRAEVRKALVAALDDGDGIVRAAAANALGAVPRTDALDALAEASRDRDPLVSKWAGWALRRTVAGAAKVRVAGLDVHMAAPGRPEPLVRAFQGALLGVLLGAGGRFDVAATDASLDFSDEGDPAAEAVPRGDSDADRKALELMRQGKFDAAALAGGADEPAPDPPATVRLAADVDARDAPPGAVAKARLRLSLEGTGVLFEVAVEGVGRPRVLAPGERDQYTMDKRPDELRGEASDAAGGEAARALMARMSQVEEAPGARAGAGNGGRP
jgi:hypothetical protein